MANKKFEMTPEHKQALAEGRAQGRAVRAYLEALDAEKATGPRTDPETLRTRITEAQEAVEAEADPAKRLELIQKRLDLEAKLEKVAEAADLDALEADFVAAAAPYSERKGITYAAWREAGVPASVLKQAGIRRTRKTS